MTTFSGYTLDEIDRAALDLLQTLSELGTPVPLCRLALCRALIATGDEETELDTACKLLDDLSDYPIDASYRRILEEEEE